MKSQGVRLFDVFILGPFMMYQAGKKTEKSQLERNFLFWSGVFTIIYNGANYLRAK